MATRLIALCLLFLSLGGPLVYAQQSSGLHQKILDEESKTYLTAYQAALTRFDQLKQEFPYNVVTYVERCRYIQSVLYREEGYIESSEEDFEQCELQLDEFAEHPEVVLFKLEDTYGDPGLEKATDLANSDLMGWTNLQKARLQKIVSDRYDLSDKEKAAVLAQAHAYKSYQLYASEDTQVLAAEYMLLKSKKKDALEIILDTPAAGNAYVDIAQKVGLMLDLGAKERAIEELASVDADHYVDHAKVAKKLAEYSEIELARTHLEKAETQWNRGQLALTKLGIEREWGDSESSLAAYNAHRDLGFTKDPLLVTRLNLGLQYPNLAWRWRDFVGLLSLVLTLGVVALVPAFWVVPVHYRGLVRARAGKLQPWLSDAPCNLRDAWLVSSGFLIVVAVLLMAFDYQSVVQLFESSYSNSDEPDMEDTLLAKWAWFETVGFALVALAALPRLHWRVLGAPKVSVLRGVGLVVVSVLGLWLILGVMRALLGDLALDTEQPGAVTPLMEIMLALNNTYGPLATIGIIGVLTPIVEEIAFRGVLLNGFSKHISFWGANLTQGAIFASLHEWSLFPFFLGFALATGFLHKRTGGLAVPIGVHAVHNTVIASIFVMYVGT